MKQNKEIVNKLILTKVDCEIDGDVFYPKMNFSDWKKVSTESYERDDENEFNFKVETYLKTSLIQTAE